MGRLALFVGSQSQKSNPSRQRCPTVGRCKAKNLSLCKPDTRTHFFFFRRAGVCYCAVSDKKSPNPAAQPAAHRHGCIAATIWPRLRVLDGPSRLHVVSIVCCYLTVRTAPAHMSRVTTLLLACTHKTHSLVDAGQTVPPWVTFSKALSLGYVIGSHGVALGVADRVPESGGITLIFRKATCWLLLFEGGRLLHWQHGRGAGAAK